jgi:hypothetical protein
MNAMTDERDSLILAAQTGDAAALLCLLVVCQAGLSNSA